MNFIINQVSNRNSVMIKMLKSQKSKGFDLSCKLEWKPIIKHLWGLKKMRLIKTRKSKEKSNSQLVNHFFWLKAIMENFK
jgi:hypothetical protein